MLQLVYDSLSGNVRRFTEGLAGELGLPMQDVRMPPPGEYLLLTYTFGKGEPPASTVNFLRQYGSGLRGVVASGSFHWGDNFARAADVIAEQYGVPVVAKLNKGGTQADRERVLSWLREYCNAPPQAVMTLH